MKIKLYYLSFIILFLFIIMLIIYFIYINKYSLTPNNKEGFITKFYRPYYRTFKRQMNKYFKLF